MYCKVCGTEINDGNFCHECGTSFHTNVTSNDLKSNPKFLQWTKTTSVELGLWGIFNLFFASYFGIMFLFFAILIYITKSYNVILIFGAVWLLSALYQLYLGLFVESNFIFYALINGVFSIYLIYKINKFQENSVKPD